MCDNNGVFGRLSVVFTADVCFLLVPTDKIAFFVVIGRKRALVWCFFVFQCNIYDSTRKIAPNRDKKSGLCYNCRLSDKVR